MFTQQEIPQAIPIETITLIETILDEAVPRDHFRDYSITEVTDSICDLHYKRLVLDLKEDIGEIDFRETDEIADLCMSFLKKYKSIHDEFKRIHRFRKLHKGLYTAFNTKKPSKATL